MQVHDHTNCKDIDCRNLHDLTREPVGPGFFLFYNLTAKRVFCLVKFYPPPFLVEASL